MKESNPNFWKGVAVVIFIILLILVGRFVIRVLNDTPSTRNITPVENAATTSNLGEVKGVVTYPNKLPTTYITAVDWPPEIATSTDAYSCNQAGKETAQAGITEEKSIQGMAYCITKESEGAAGSTYTNYVYMWKQGDELIYMRFSTRSVQCMNYDDPKQTECLNERNTFDIDAFADSIAKTLQ